MAGGNNVDAATDGRFAAAHRALIGDPGVQFTFSSPPVPPKPPKWLDDFLTWLGHVLKPVWDFFDRVSDVMPALPWARVLLWTIIVVAALAVLLLVVERVRHGEWRMPLRRRARALAVGVADEEWAPDAAPARRWLEEADALAARGAYAEAIHHLLLRSVEDIGRRRPDAVRPALTSRELAAAPAIPGSARSLFARIAGQVERSLFGGRPVGDDDWRSARAAYADFALPGMWRA
ncbi:DUF4129 domain-containing protein [uncultured Sphingomonas sp.]|uniref:DUF4129 domain-containing protein n=1 Tax=uncultured Sphingomonas sp. TaxID=158754 RepID=UPI0035C9EFC0